MGVYGGTQGCAGAEVSEEELRTARKQGGEWTAERGTAEQEAGKASQTGAEKSRKRAEKAEGSSELGGMRRAKRRRTEYRRGTCPSMFLVRKRVHVPRGRYTHAR